MTERPYYAEPGTIIPGSATTFSPCPTGARYRCNICGRSGYATHADVYVPHWQRSCLRGHGACRGCGKLISLTLDGSIRAGHKGCKGARP